jgi:AbrB family looped-hinge helix DNA binding protein
MASLSKITAQGQTSVPLTIRKKLGIGPGSVLEWETDGETVVVRRAGRYTSEDIHRALFPKGAPKRRTLKDLRKGIEEHMKNRHARG